MKDGLIGTTDGVTGMAVREVLDRALASPEFRLSARMSQLLRFLVEATLEARCAELKETVIGVEVFGRSPDYDPKIDPVVRKEARRLRLKLQEYYQGSGSGEAVRIDVPKGGYVPVFGSGSAVEPQPGVPVVEAPAVVQPRRLRWVLSGVAVLMLLTGGLAVLRTNVRRTVLVPQALTGNSGVERSPAFSPDGTQIAFSWDSESAAEPAIYIQSLHGDSPRRITSSGAYENNPVWSPDGKEIAFLRHTARDAYAVTVRSLTGGSERVLTEISALDQLDWSPNGGAIAGSDAMPGAPTSIIFISPANGSRRQITTPPAGSGDTVPRFSPDGRRLAFLRALAKDSTELHILDLTTRQPPVRLTNENRKIEGFTWAPDGASLVLSVARGATARSLWRLTVNGGAMERIAAAGTFGITPVWSGKTGVLAYVERRSDINLWRIRTDAPTVPAIVANSRNLDSSPAISADGTEVAFRSDRSGTNEIWRTSLFENQASRLTWINGPLTGSPSWSPDGQWIAFDSRVSGNSDILLSPAAGGPWRNLTDAPSSEVVPRWSHDGKWIYFGSDRGGRWQIWKQHPSGGVAEQVTWGGGYVAAESPDGKYVYFMRGRNEGGLYRIPVAGGNEEPILPAFAGKLWGNWVVTTEGIYYMYYPPNEPSTMSTIRFLDLNTRQTRDVYRLPKHPVLWDGGMALSPDGKWLVFGQLEYSGSSIQVLEGFQ